jgi:cell division protease FtsH
VLGVPTSGAGGAADSDLALATRLAAAPLASLGLEPGFGLSLLSSADLPDLPRMIRDIPGLGLAINDTIRVTYAEALDVVWRHTSAVVAVANALIEKRAITGVDVERIVANSPVDDDVGRQAAAPRPTRQRKGRIA